MSDDITPEIYRMNEAIERQMVWDIFPHDAIDNDLFETLGLGPSSDEGWEFEHGLSHARVDGVEGILDLVATLSTMSATLIARAILAGASDEVSEEVVQIFREQVEAHVTAGTLAVIMELVSIGAMNVTGEWVGHE